MSIKSRRTAFYFLLLAFFITGPVLLMWSEGYRYDFENRKIVAVGGIFLKSSPPDVVISSGKNFHKNVGAGIFYSGTLIKNLIPRTYEIAISHAGFFAWKKDIEVQPSLVAKASHIWLLPQNLPSFKIAEAASVRNFILAPTGNTIFYANQNGSQVWNFRTDNLNLSSLNQSSSSLNLLLPISILDLPKSRNGARIKSIEFSPDGSKIIFKEANDWLIYRPDESIPFLLAKTYFAANFQKTFPLATTTPVIKNIFWNGNRNGIIVQSAGGLYVVNFDNNRIAMLSAKPVLATGSIDNNFYFINNAGGIYRATSANSAELQFSFATSTIPALNNSDIIERIGDSFLAIDSNKSLVLISRDGITKNIANSISFFAETKDGPKLALISNNELILLPLKDILDDVQFQQLLMYNLGAINEDPKDILGLWWTKDSEHILIATDHGFTIYEGDPRPPANQMNFSIDSIKAAAFDPSKNTAYYLSGNDFYTMQFAPESP